MEDTKRILLADDDRDIREVGRVLLENEGKVKDAEPAGTENPEAPSEENPEEHPEEHPETKAEVERFKEFGGETIVDAQPVGSGRDAAGLNRV